MWPRDAFPRPHSCSKRSEAAGSAGLEVTSDLTIKGTPVGHDPVRVRGRGHQPFGNLRVGFEGSAVINRKDYGNTSNAALETGGVPVSDKSTLEFEVSAIKTA